MSIAVVILFGSGRDGAKLGAVMESIATQTRPPDELVLVLNGATAPTFDPPVQIPTRIVALDEDRGCPAGRNVGARASTSDVIVFVDDDGVLDHGALTAVYQAFARWPAAAAFAGSVVDQQHDAPQRRLADGDPVLHYSGGAFAIRRRCFFAVDGYFEHSARQGEEFDLALKLLRDGYVIRALPSFVLYHPERKRDWRGREQLLSTLNSVRIFASYFPAGVALAGIVWKVLRHAAVLTYERDFRSLPRLFAAAVGAVAAGLGERRALTWRQYWTARYIIHPGGIVRALSPNARGA